MFDKVVLLSEGQCLYFGKGSDAMRYFQSVGFAPSFPMNPADFLLDLANGTSQFQPFIFLNELQFNLLIKTGCGVSVSIVFAVVCF